jgi:homoserine dehydrogenase
MDTHEGPESAVQQAMDLLRDSDCLTEPPLVLQILGA